MGKLVLGDRFGNRAGTHQTGSLELVQKVAREFRVSEDLAVGIILEESALGKNAKDNPMQLSPSDPDRWKKAKGLIEADPANKARYMVEGSMDRLREGLEKHKGDRKKAVQYYHRPKDIAEEDTTYVDSVLDYAAGAREEGLVAMRADPKASEQAPEEEGTFDFLLKYVPEALKRITHEDFKEIFRGGLI